MPQHAQQLQDTALRYLLEVVRCGSLAEASQRLHVAGSAISRQIASLEALLDTPLFERQPRGMVPTAAGELLAAHARRMGLETERVLGDIQALKGLQGGLVRLATTEGFAATFLPRLVTAWRQRHPRVRIDLQVLATADVAQRLRHGEADIGLCFSRAPERDIQTVHRQPCGIVAVMRPDHPLAGARQLTLARLAQQPLALPSPDTTLRQLVDLACSRQQLLLEPAFTSNSLATLLAFVQDGGALTLCAEISVSAQVQARQLALVPLRDRGLNLRDIELQTLAGRQLSGTAQALLRHLVQELPAHLGAPPPAPAV